MYMYQMLSKAIFDVEERSKIKRDWSPNTIKNIVILRDSIIVVYHTTRQTKILPLNEEALMDIQSNGSKGSLHNVLGAFQLSCLEEIYIDSVFKNYPGTLDLGKYVQGLINSKSRLRYYGFVQYNDYTLGIKVGTFYDEGKSRQLEDYTLGESRVIPLELYSSNNIDWYKKYNLRPDKYPTDKEHGILDAWFTKVSKDLATIMSAKEAELKGSLYLQRYSELLQGEFAKARTYRLWYAMIKELKAGKGNEFGRALYNVLGEFNSDFKPKYYISKEILNEACQKGIINESNPEQKYILSMLNVKGVINNEKATQEYLDSQILTNEDLGKEILNTKAIISITLNNMANQRNKGLAMYLWNACIDSGCMLKEGSNPYTFLQSKYSSEGEEVDKFIQIGSILINACGFNEEYLMRR